MDSEIVWQLYIRPFHCLIWLVLKAKLKLSLYQTNYKAQFTLGVKLHRSMHLLWQ
jgi:hypothetical protein